MTTNTFITNSCLIATLSNVSDDMERLQDIADYIAEHDYENTAEWNGNDELTLWVYFTRNDMDIAALAAAIEGN